jgi:hypothetical protein
MHNSKNGTNMMGGGKIATNGSTTTGAALGRFLLQGGDQSSTCLNCHGDGSTLNGYHVKTAGATTGGVPANFTPGGDFSWTMIDCADDASRNSARGHNINATDFGMSADSRLSTAPGGAYLAADLHCSSCHDPHGKYRMDASGNFDTTGGPIEKSGSYGTAASSGAGRVGAYRFLAGEGYLPKSVTDASLDFDNAPPIASVPSSYNSTTPGGIRVGYGSGMSEWCANCHGDFHAPGEESIDPFTVHPAGNDYDLGALATIYNSYVSSGMTGTPDGNGTWNLVPYEKGLDGAEANRATLLTLAGSTDGPDATSNVMCLSCHRAHASGFKSMLRWSMEDAFITDSAGAYEVEYGLVNDAVTTAAYQNVDAGSFGAFQRVLCNKCHAKD